MTRKTCVLLLQRLVEGDLKQRLLFSTTFGHFFLTKELGDSWILFFSYCKFTQFLNTTKIEKGKPSLHPR
jgi:hypothetical protein